MNLRPLGIFLLLLLLGCQVRYRRDVEPKGTPPKWQYGYYHSLRYDGYQDIAGDLESALLVYRKPLSPVVILIPLLPIAEKEYYQNLKKFLRRCSLVLVGREAPSPPLRVILDSTASLLGLRPVWKELTPEKHWKSLPSDFRLLTFPFDEKKLRALEKSLIYELELPKVVEKLKKELTPILSPLALEDLLRHYGALELVRSNQGIEAKLWQYLFKTRLFLKGMEKDVGDLPVISQLFRTLRLFFKTVHDYQSYQRNYLYLRTQALLELFHKELKKRTPPSVVFLVSLSQLEFLLPALRSKGYKKQKSYWIKAWRMNSRNLFALVPSLPSLPSSPKPFSSPVPSSPKVPFPAKKLQLLWKQYLESSWKERQVLEQKLCRLGDVALLFLLERTRSPRPLERQLALKVLAQFRSLSPLVISRLFEIAEKDKKTLVRIAALKALQKHSLSKKAHFQKLKKLFQKERDPLCLRALAALMAKYPSVFSSFLLQRLRSSSLLHRQYALFAFSRMPSPPPREALPFALQSLSSSSLSLKKEALRLLRRYPQKVSQILPSLLKLLRSHPKSLYPDILLTLESFGDKAVSAVPLLIQMAKKQKKDRYLFLRTLAKIGKNSDKTLSFFLEILRTSQNQWEKIEVLKGLEKFGSKAAPATPLLIRLLEEKDPALVLYTIRVLRAIGPKAKPALPYLKKLRKNPWHRWEVEKALRSIQRQELPN